MTDRYRRQWETLGAEDPYWAVLSAPEKKGGQWDKAEFFQTGADEIEALFAKIARLGASIRFGLALDYGCGVGRLSRALATSFQRVLGVDMSETMLTEARAVNAGFGNIMFMRNNGENLAGIADSSVDFIYSNLVLQHSPRKTQRLLIREFCRVLGPGGLLVFQAPSHQNLRTVGGLAHFLFGNALSNLATSIRHGKKNIMEMHHIRVQEVLGILREEGLQTVEAEPCNSAGTAFISYRYFAIKR